MTRKAGEAFNNVRKSHVRLFSALAVSPSGSRGYLITSKDPAQLRELREHLSHRAWGGLLSVTTLSSFPPLTEEFKGIKITFYQSEASAQSIFDLLGRVDVIPLDRRTIYLPVSETQSNNSIIERMLDLNQKLVERNFSPRFLAYDVGAGC
jgi:hypothetical protein